jgi:hypothetical protein
VLRLYTALVVPHLEYAAAVWQTSTHTHKLESIQMKGLALCMGGLKTGRREAMEVTLGILPLALRRDELAVREIGKVMALVVDEPVWETVGAVARR